MKTNSDKKIKGLKVLFLVGMIMSSLNVISQNPFASVELTSNVSGNGLGGNVCPSLALTFHRSTFSLGPNFQIRNRNYSGLHVDYKYSVATNESGKLELFLLGNLNCNVAAHLSNTNVDVESSNGPEGARNCSQLRLNVIDGYAGFGVRVYTGKSFSTIMGTGVGMYHTLDKGYDTNMYRQRSALSLQVQVGIVYTIKANYSFF